MTGQTCALTGCINPPCSSVRHGASPPFTCGSLHHLLLMAARFNPSLPPPYQAVLHRNAAGLCALLSCEAPPCVGSSWCTPAHSLQWLAQFISSLHPEQICMLPRCTRHVFVDDNAHASQFCGWRHQQKFVMLNARPHRQQDWQSSVQALPQQQRSPASVDKSEGGHMSSLNSRMHSLKQFAHFGIAPKNIRVVEDFYEKHPWEVLAAAEEQRSCWLIACLKFTGKGRKLTTKGHYHWKQSGRRAKNTGKYYTYTRRNGKEKEADQQPAESSMWLYTMKEFTVDDVPSHALIHLVREKRSSYAKRGKEQRTQQQIGDNQAPDNVSPADTLPLELTFGDDQDSIYGGLSLIWDDLDSG